MAGSGLPGRLPLIFRFSRPAGLIYGPVNLLAKAGTFILVNRPQNVPEYHTFLRAVHALSFPDELFWLTSNFKTPPYYTRTILRFSYRWVSLL